MKKEKVNLFFFLFIIFISLLYPKDVKKSSYQKRKVYIYIDSSGSMRGFVGINRAYSKILLNLDNALLLSGIERKMYTVRKVGKNLTTFKGNISCFSEDEAQYSAKKTNLSIVADEIVRKKPSIAILITDSELDISKNVSQGERCLTGYDLSCLTFKFGPLLTNFNYSLVVVGVKSKYTGALYPPSKSSIVLTKPIYKPVIFYFFFKESEIDKIKSIIREIKNSIKDIVDNDKNTEIRIARIAPLLFPEIKVSEEECSDIFSNKGRLIYALDSSEKEKGVLKCSFSKVSKMKAYEKLEIKIPIEYIEPIYNIIPFENSILYNFDGSAKSPVEGISFINNKRELFIRLKSKTTYLRGGLNLSVKIKIKAKIDDVKIFRDWSTSTIGEDYKKGKTLYLSNFLEFLYRFYVRHVDERERVYKLIDFSFHN